LLLIFGIEVYEKGNGQRQGIEEVMGEFWVVDIDGLD
jgi:hypothetical protein